METDNRPALFLWWHGISHYSPIAYLCLAFLLHSRKVPDRAAVGGSMPGNEAGVVEKPEALECGRAARLCASRRSQ
jgi:hypothetical protein